jgi:hypothetical protein
MSRKDKLIDQEYRKTVNCTKYIKLLKKESVNIPCWNDTYVNADQIDVKYVCTHGLDQPLLIKNGKADLQMRMLQENISLTNVADMLGGNTVVKVIDVGAQEELDDWTFGEYAR